MRIAILAWGSLIWEPRTLAIDGVFQPRGPALPIEFSRISKDRRLTLVIDEACGTRCLIYAAESARADLAGAAENLRLREGMPGIKGIGFVVTTSGRQSATAEDRHPGAVAVIAAWARTAGYDAAIWTALASNFLQETSEAFSVTAAIRHLEKLDDPARAGALNYIRRAPREVQTPLRSAVNLRWPNNGFE